MGLQETTVLFLLLCHEEKWKTVSNITKYKPLAPLHISKKLLQVRTEHDVADYNFNYPKNVKHFIPYS